MKRAVVISLMVHLAAIGGVVAGTREQRDLLPGKVYSVDLVSMPVAQRGSGGGPMEGAPKARSGVKVDKAPSREILAPRGVKKPKESLEQKGGKSSDKGRGMGIGKGGEGGGLRTEGEPFPYPEYLQDMLMRIEEQWHKPLSVEPDQMLKATVFFTIERDGTVVECRVESGSGQRDFDRAALEAVLKASPLSPLPEGFRGKGLGVHLDFKE